MNDSRDGLRELIAQRHFYVGWTGLLLFLVLGSVLEALHGYKVGFYLDPDAKLRRELWRLAHAHGTLLALINLAFASGLMHFGQWPAGRLKLASFFLIDAVILIPLGFFLGGLAATETDPWVGVYLVPLGATLLLAAVVIILQSGGLKSPIAGPVAGRRK